MTRPPPLTGLTLLCSVVFSRELLPCRQRHARAGA
jgi:hypothetical protein